MTEPKLKEIPYYLTTKLEVNDFLGADGEMYRDLAVDASSISAVVWLRRQLNTNEYFLVVSLLRGHVLKKKIDKEEAQAFYLCLPSKVDPKEAFEEEVEYQPIEMKMKNNKKPKKNKRKVDKQLKTS